MDDFSNNSACDFGSYSGGGYDGSYDSGYSSGFTYEPDPMPDFSIDPMAFVPGAILDCSKPGWGASLAIQRGVEMAQQMTQNLFDQMSYPEQQTWLEQQYHEQGFAREHRASERKAQIALARAEPIPLQFYSSVDLYAHRLDFTETQKQWFRHVDAARAQRAHAQAQGLGELLEQQDLWVLGRTGRYPAQCYSKVDLYAHRHDLTEDQKNFFREYDPMEVWDIVVGRQEAPWKQPADNEDNNEEGGHNKSEHRAIPTERDCHLSGDQLRQFREHMARLDEEIIEFNRKWGLRKQPVENEQGQQVFHNNFEKGLRTSNLAVTPLTSERAVQKEYPKNLKGILCFTRDCLKDSLKKYQLGLSGASP